MFPPTIYAYIKAEESRFETQEVRVGDNWLWNMRNHIQLIFHLKNGVFYTGTNDWRTMMRAFKNIMEPILNLAYWTEDIDVKDIVFYITEENGRALSFLLKKYHDEIYVKENDLDSFIDELSESDIDYGGVLVQKTSTARPEVIQFQTLAFCDQTDVLGGPICFKHTFSPDKLREMATYGWGDSNNGATMALDELIMLATPDKAPLGMQKTKGNQTPGKNIEVYILKGSLPDDYLYDDGILDETCLQTHVVAFYHDKNGKREGVTLYRKEYDGKDLKFNTTKKIPGRGLGRGVGESLLHQQVWTNFLNIHKVNMLAAAAKVPLWTDDQSFTQRQKIMDMETLEITTIEEGRRIGQIPTAAPANVQLMERAIDDLYQQGQLIGSAFDPLLGKQPSSGTTFRGQERVVQQGRGIHDRRRGQRAKFIEEIYRDWIIDDMIRGILSGTKFLATLSTEEMQWVIEKVVTYETNKKIVEMVANLQTPTPDEIAAFKDIVRQSLAQNGNKHLLEILKEEFDGIKVRIGINIAAKQKDLVGLSDKVLSIFQAAFANPVGFIETMKIPGMAKSFQDILEYGGMSPVDFSAFLTMPAITQQSAPQPTPPSVPQPVSAQPTAA